MFILNMYKKSGADGVYCYIRKNRSNVVKVSVSTQSGYGLYESSGSTVLHLDPGDKVDVGYCGNPSDIVFFTSFIGFLLQAD